MMKKATEDGRSPTKRKHSQSSSASEKQEENKSVYICVQNPNNIGYSWFSITTRSGRISIEEINEISSTYPPNLRDLMSYAFAFLQQSKIFFIGGEIRDSNRDFSNKVFAFDTNSRIWVENVKSMNASRAFHTAVAVRNKIYVFGCSSVRKNLTPEQWGECYDHHSNTWVYLPKPPQEVYHVSDISSHAVCETRNLILLWVFSLGVYLFDFGSNVWLSSIHTTIPQGPRWSNRVAVVKDVIFWHYFGTIYAYDLLKGQTLELYTFEDAHEKFGQRLAPDPDGHPGPTFLVHLGGEILCLVWLDFFLQDKLHCYTFRVEGEGEGDGSLRLVSEGSTAFPFQGYDIEDILEIEL